MRHFLAGGAVALSLALGSSAALASVPDIAEKLQQASDQTVFQRKDVDESSRPPPPSGPSSQTLTCNPSAPDCP